MIRAFLAEAWDWVRRNSPVPLVVPFAFVAVFAIALGFAFAADASSAPRGGGDLAALRDRVTKLEHVIDRQNDKLLRTRYKTSKLTIDGEYVIGHTCADLDAVWDEFGRLSCPGFARR